MIDLSENVLSMAREVDAQCFEFIKKIEDEGKLPGFLAVNIVDTDNLKKAERGATSIMFSLVSEIVIFSPEEKQNIINELITEKVITEETTTKDIIKGLVSSMIDHTNIILAQNQDDVEDDVLATLATFIRSFEPRAIFTFITIDLDMLNNATGDLSFAVAIGPKPNFLEIL